MNDDKRDKLIQQSIPKKEQEELEKDLQINKREREEVALELGIRAAVEEASRKELRKKIRSFEERRGYQASLAYKRYLAVAASIAAFFVVGWWLLQNQPTSQELYLSYHEKYPNNLAPITRSDEQNTNLRAEGLRNYEKGNYDEAIVSLSGYLAEISDTGAQLYLGLSYLESGDVDNAISSLGQVVASGDPLFVETASWYLALGFLQKENINASRKHLQNIVQGKGAYQQKAKELLKEL